MRLRVLQGILAVLVLIFLYSSTHPPPGIEPPPPRQRPPSHAAPIGPSAGDDTSGRAPKRNLFEYGQAAPPPVMASAAPVETAFQTPSATPTRAPIKLVGLVHQGHTLRAALAMDGEIVLGEKGQSVSGYTIVSIDDDRGVVLSGPDGTTLELRP